MVKIVGSIVEQSNVSVRNIRRDSLEKFRSLEKNKEISQDISRKAQQDLQKLTDSFTDSMDVIKTEKEKEILQI